MHKIHTREWQFIALRKLINTDYDTKKQSFLFRVENDSHLKTLFLCHIICQDSNCNLSGVKVKVDDASRSLLYIGCLLY